MPTTTLRRSPLHERQRAASARFVEFAEWEVAESFGSPESEYDALNSTVGVVDMCHEGRLKLEGLRAADCLNPLTTIDVTKIELNTEKRCFALNESGGIADMIDVFRSERYWSIHCSAVGKARVEAELQAAVKSSSDAILSDATTTQGSVLVMGPLAPEVLADGILEGSVPKEDGTSAILQIGQGRCLVTKRRMGTLPYYLINVGGIFVENVWERLCGLVFRREGAPAGLRAFEMARVEAGVPRVGAEIDERTTPFEIGAMTLVEYSKQDFQGRKPLLHSTCAEFARRLVYLRFDGTDCPQAGDSVEADGIPIGHITSAATIPRLKCTLAMAFVDALRSTKGLMLSVRTHGGHVLFAYVSDPAEARTGAR